MLYEYRCRACGDQIVSSDRLHSEELDEHGHDGSEITYLEYPYCGPLKRVWSVGFQIKSTDWGH